MKVKRTLFTKVVIFIARDKTSTRIKIIREARSEFLTFGFEKASIRRIAEKAGVVPSALYRHFKDKEALFSYFVEPALTEYDKICETDMNEVYEMLDSEKVDQIWSYSDEQFTERIRFIYKHYEAFKLLCTSAEGTKYNDFQHQLVEKDVQSSMLLWKGLKEKGLPVRNIDEKDLQIITRGVFGSLLEFIMRDYSEEEALQRSKTIAIFFNSGMRSIFGL
ncbi:MAG: TetR/AcrR family transcriptional regulator [Spirochaetales bacterium]|nr:TetR/AcrR family transcriptional regulator [Spirochaetales bacterium]